MLRKSKPYKYVYLVGIFVVGALALQACGASRSDVHSESDRELTLGIVQKEIHPGISQGEVATHLGSPNLVSRDGNGQETWIYDKVASEESYSTSGPFLFDRRNRGYRASTQRTMTVVIKFDSDSTVSNVSYHTSQF